MPPITDDPINNSNLGVLTLHLSVVRLLVVARPRPSMLGELLDCQDHLDQQAITNILQEPTKSTKVHKMHTRLSSSTSVHAYQIWNIRYSRRSNEPAICAHQHAFTTMTFLFLSGIVKFNAHVWRICPLVYLAQTLKITLASQITPLITSKETKKVVSLYRYDAL
jgi:hypothetical protein